MIKTQTFHFLSPELPKWGPGTLIKEPYFEGWRHIQGTFSADTATRKLLHLMSGIALLIPVINIVVYVAARILLNCCPKPVIAAERAARRNHGPSRPDHAEELPVQKEVLQNQSAGPNFGPFSEKDTWANDVFKAGGNIPTSLIETGREKGFLAQTHGRFLYGTILHQLAKRWDSRELLESLIRERAIDLSIQDNYGADRSNTALIWAVANACNENALTIIEHAAPGPHFDLQGLKRNTALHLIVGKGYKDRDIEGRKLAFSNLHLLQTLLAKGANPNIQNEDGNTPLHLAYLRRDQEMIETLLKAKADPNVRNHAKDLPSAYGSKDYDFASKHLRSAVDFFYLDETKFLNPGERSL